MLPAQPDAGGFALLYIRWDHLCHLLQLYCRKFCHPFPKSFQNFHHEVLPKWIFNRNDHEKNVSFKSRSGYIGKFWNIPDKLEWEGRDICKTAAESKRKRIEILSSAHTCSPESTLNMDILKRNQTKLETMSNTCKHIAQVSKH